MKIYYNKIPIELKPIIHDDIDSTTHEYFSSGSGFKMRLKKVIFCCHDSRIIFIDADCLPVLSKKIIAFCPFCGAAISREQVLGIWKH